MPELKAILVAEDDENDFFLIRVALEAAGFNGNVIHARGGAEAIDWLKQAGPDDLPALLLLDLKMPRGDGFDVLEWKDKNRLPCVPAIVLSASPLERDVARAYQLGAHSYAAKPLGLENRTNLCRGLLGWWRNWCELPKIAAGAS